MLRRERPRWATRCCSLNVSMHATRQLAVWAQLSAGYACPGSLSAADTRCCGCPLPVVLLSPRRSEVSKKTRSRCDAMRIASLGGDTHSSSCWPAGDPGGLLAPGSWPTGGVVHLGTLDEEEEWDNGSRLNSSTTAHHPPRPSHLGPFSPGFSNVNSSLLTLLHLASLSRLSFRPCAPHCCPLETGGPLSSTAHCCPQGQSPVG
jgi:hypothetical protein